MNIKNKILLILLTFIIAVSGVLLVSCGGDDTPDPAGSDNSGSQSESGADTDTAVGGFDVAKDGTAIDIVYSIDHEDATYSPANSIATTIKNLSGAVAEVCVDASGAVAADASAILVGYTRYAESAQVYAELEDYSQCIIKTVGNKLVIASYDEAAIKTAATKLTIAFNSGKNGKNIAIASDYTNVFSGNETLAEAKLPILAGKYPIMIDQGDERTELVFTSADDTHMDTYAKQLTDRGYRLYAQNKIDDNDYRTYVNDTNVINVNLVTNMSKLFVTADTLSQTALPGLESENTYTKDVTSTLFTQIGLYTSGNPAESTAGTNGMSYVMRLEDGSFIIIDGGHGDPEDASNLLKTLREQAPDPNKIVIAAWVFTHAHSDHVLTFEKFAKAYATTVTVEKFIFNFPTAARATDGGGDNRSNVINAIATTAYANVPKVKAHFGQVFYIRNAKITMLSSLELLEPFTMKNDNSYNDTSLIFTLEAEGTKIMILGDSYSKTPSVLRQIYTASTLKSEVMQVAHHGIGCGTADPYTALYKMIDADHVFWPAGSYLYANYPKWWGVNSSADMRDYNWNKWIVDNVDTDKIYLAADDVFVADMSSGFTVTRYDNVDAYCAAQ